jgi:AAA15 family ATPase/GTPase
MHGLRKVKLKIKWPGRPEKSTNLVENLKEINYRFHTLYYQIQTFVDYNSIELTMFEKRASRISVNKSNATKE